MAVGNELDHQVLLDTMVAVTRGIELYRDLLLDPPVAVTSYEETKPSSSNGSLFEGSNGTPQCEQ